MPDNYDDDLQALNGERLGARGNNPGQRHYKDLVDGKGHGPGNQHGQADKSSGGNSPNKEASLGALENQAASGSGGLFNAGRDKSGKATGNALSKVKSALWGNRKRKAGTVGSGFIVGAGVTISLLGVFIGAPFQLMHIAQLFERTHLSQQDDSSGVRMGRLYRFAKTGVIGETRVGYVGSKYANQMKGEMKARGLTVNVDKAGVFKGYIIDTKVSGTEFSGKSPSEIERTLKNRGIRDPKVTSLPNGETSVAIKGFFDGRRSLRVFAKAGDYGKIAAYTRFRSMAKFTFMDFHPLRPLDKATNRLTAKAYRAAYDKWKKGHDAKIKSGIKGSVAITDGAAQEGTGPDGQPTQQPLDDATRSDVTEGVKDKGRIAKALKTVSQSKSASVVGGAALAQMAVCMMRELANKYDEAKWTQTVVPAMRLAGDVQSMASQSGSGVDTDATTMAFATAALEKLNEKGKAVNTWEQSESVMAQEGKTGKGVPPPQALTSVGESVPSALAWTQGDKLASVCSTTGLIVGGGVSLALGIISGGTVSTLAGLIGGALLIPKAMDFATGLITGDALDVAGAAGADWGSIADYGTLFLGNSMSQQLGGATMSNTELAALNTEGGFEAKTEFQNKSFAHRLFDTSDDRTFASATLRGSSSLAPAKFGSTLAALPGNLMKLPAAIFSPAKAAPKSYDYGVSKIGFSLDDQENPLVDNPYTNAEAAAKILDGPDGATYVQRAYDCFGVNVTKVDNLWQATADLTIDTADPQNPLNTYRKGYPADECREKGNNDWLQVRFFIQDSGIMDGYACFYGDDQACQNVGVTPGDDIGSESTGEGGTFRIASFNVLGATHTKGDSYKGRMDKSLQTLNTNNVDIAGLQEFQAPQRAYLLSKAGSQYAMYPTKSDYDHHYSENSIIWDKSKFTIDESASGVMPELKYFEGSKLDAPYVKLTYTATGQQFYVLNVHDPASTGRYPRNERNRYDNALKHVDFINKLKADNIPIFFTGDFNSGFTSRDSPGENGYPWQGKDENLTYCIMTKGSVMNDAYDLARNRNAKCPNEVEPQDKKLIYGGIDHVYTSPGVTATNYTPVSSGKNGSDHPTVIFDVTMPGSGQNQFTIGTYNLLDAKAHKADSNKIGGCDKKPVANDPDCVNTRTARQADIITGKAGNPVFDVFGTQETSPDQYSTLKSRLSGYSVFPTDTSGLANNIDGELAIWWDKDKFSLAESGKAPGRSNIATNINNPWVKLQTIDGSKSFYVMSVHYANATFGGSAAEHTKAATKTLDWVQSVASADTPVFVVGDFNEHFAKANPAPRATLPDTAYCFLTSAKANMQNIYDASKGAGAKGQCPTKANPGPDDTGYENRGKDQMFMSTGSEAKAVSWSQASYSDIYATASDHTPVYASIDLGGTDETQQGGWQWPVKKTSFKYLSQCFEKPGHTGIDIPVPVGTPVYAARAGTVVKVDPSGGTDGGQYIIIQHEASLFTNYQHNSQLLVNEGKQVNVGDQIALSGNTGYVSGAHVHFSVTTQNGLDSRNTVAYSVNPLQYLPNDRNEAPCAAAQQ